MATYYVGSGGNDSNDGLSWANRFLTLNGAEDEPVAADDTVYVGPGVYREVLNVDVSGGAGTPITYIADVTGEHTDGVGGIVRITGSDNDQTATRANCISGRIGAGDWDYRTFRGFSMDTCSAPLVALGDTSPTNWIFEDCFFFNGANEAIWIRGDSQADNIVRRCVFLPQQAYCTAVEFTSVGGCVNATSTVENCLMLGGNNDSIQSDDVGGITVRNCSFLGTRRAVIVTDTLPGGYTAITVNNCIIMGCVAGLEATGVGEIVENYNNFWGNNTDRISVNAGGNSVAYAPLLLSLILHSGASQVSGFKFPWLAGELSEWSQIAAITGSNEPDVDLLGIDRPATASKNSWGAIQYHDVERETGTTRGSSVASIVLHDAGRHQIWVPVAAVSITVSVYVYRETNYAGGNPQMIIKQPGVADRTTTDAGAATTWNQLSDTFAPGNETDYIIVELVSNNTAAAGSYEVFFDDLTVT